MWYSARFAIQQVMPDIGNDCVFVIAAHKLNMSCAPVYWVLATDPRRNVQRLDFSVLRWIAIEAALGLIDFTIITCLPDI